MKISWKTNGSAGAVEFMENRLSTGSKTDYKAWAESNGRINFKYEVVGDELIITEEWNITRDEYDALDITPVDQPQADGVTLPMVETDQHLSF
tara:strand:+ start:243 stop:521 length:279 start_codon:yes stop_codon:yes gene_type:complete